MDRLIAAIAARQQGLITRWQLLALGLSEHAIDNRIEAGRLHVLHRGVYAVGFRPVSPHARALAAVLACGEGAVLSHGSAATLWGITKHWRTQLEVTARSQHLRPGVCVHRSRTLTPRDITEHFGIPVTSPARTVLDIADGLDDAALARAVNDLRHARYLSVAELAELVADHAPSRATKRLRKFIARPDRMPTRSELEDAFKLFVERYELPEPEINAEVLGHEVDVLFRAHKLVVELDGYEFHSDREQFETDRDRDADLLAAEIATVRLTSDRLSDQPAREASRLHAILARRAPKITP